MFMTQQSRRRLNIDDHEGLITLFHLPNIEKRTIQELHGLATAFIYDGVISDSEISLLTDWLNNNEFLYDTWPVSRLIELLHEILEDGVITDDERKELLTFLSGIASPISPDDRVANTIFSDDKIILFKEKYFIFTGKLQLGKRKRAEEEVLKRGGLCPGGSYKRWIDYLVVGDLGQDCWKYSKYGTKIESCMNALDNGRTNTAIIREERFIAAIIDNPL